MKILLGLTGSVASVLHLKLVKELQAIGDVSVILTEKAEHFISDDFDGVKVFREKHEWKWFHADENEEDGSCDGPYCSPKWRKNDPVLHIELRDKYSALVISPCSANTVGKIANGICDNLLTSVVRAWDKNRPLIIAPAMNTAMWEHPVTDEHLKKLRSWGYKLVMPQEKMLACGTQGVGALANIEDIVKVTKDSLRWLFPIPINIERYDTNYCSGIPVGTHPGAFGTKRKYSIHTGVDLYTKEGQPIIAVEDGKVMVIEPFTGPKDKSPWWNDTDCILVEGASGVVCYGEIEVMDSLKVGMNIKQGFCLGYVKRVLPDGKERPDISGHSTSMLHMELYPHGYYKPSDGWEKDVGILRNPTPYLLDSADRPSTVL